MKSCFKIFRRALSTVICLIGATALLLIAPKLFQINPAIILSGSMSPTLEVGDITYIMKIKDDNYQVGDIISFRYEGVEKSSIHRIMDIDADHNIYTKGDNNESMDMVTITYEQIEGKVVFTVPKLGYAVSKLQAKRWKIMLVCFVSVNFLLAFIDVDSNEESGDDMKNEVH